MTGRIRARSDDLECRVMEDAVVLLDLRTEHYLSLNRSAVELWQRIVEGTSAPELEAVLVARYGLSPDAAADDIAALLGQLRDAGLLEDGSDAAAES